MVKGSVFISLIALLALTCSLASAYDPSPLQDFCVGVNDTKLGVFVNGRFCKDPKLVNAEDFFFHIMPGNTNNPLGSQVTQVSVNEFPGLNTLGISLARIDYAPYGLNPPHTHPRATEVLTVLEGTLMVGFVASNQNNNRFFTKILNKGEVFIFPFGMIHFQINIGHYNAVALSSLSSQNPGVITIANAVFGSNPPINPDVLAKAFQVDKKIIAYLQKQQWYDNN
ncbi:germin-like protein subfamily 1 member 18 [Neltuma alba]|uniref:germin-like protein subfamily 1 member 18 n=1 Tax=Neltuma alba TaxID=207710 RepID=UPI0010A4795B|nr:germin-like protein subfamily 1 member 18 [Prosopis alba]XP_028771799.1 germin-like protein subfamily 1 member 18 [Prosopis alba]XP_028801463.1 germin-like protein subfamily 1 member 18 [Prosopis alba]